MKMRSVFLGMMVLGVALMVFGTGAILAQEDVYTVDGVELTEGELSAYAATVVTEANRMRAVVSKAEEALGFFDTLDKSLFTAPELVKIEAAKTVIRLAAKRQIEAYGAAPSTAADVKQLLVERKAKAEAEAEAVGVAVGK